MLRVARHFVGVALCCLLVTSGVVALRGPNVQMTSGLVGQPWPGRGDPWPNAAGSAGTLDIQSIDASAADDLAVTLTDGRIVYVSATGRRHFVSVRTIPTTGLRNGSGGYRRGGMNRWLVSWPHATLVDETGADVRTIGIPPRAVASLGLADGDLAFLTPGAPTLVSVINKYGVTLSEFGSPINDPDVVGMQNRWLNHGVLLEAANGDLIVVFVHQPHPVVRRYSRAGVLLAETMLQSPGLDDIAAAAREQENTKSTTCAGGLVTVFGVAYDRKSDTTWVTTASDDSIGYVRVLDARGQMVAQVQMWDDGTPTPIPPTMMAFGGNYLFWVSGRQIYRTDVTEVREAIRRGQARLGRLAVQFKSVVHAQTGACGTAQAYTANCPYTCKGGFVVTCHIDGRVTPWIAEAQQCLQPPSTPAGFRGCEKNVTWCNTTDNTRNNQVDRKSCGTDADQDTWTIEEGDCDDGNASCNPDAQAGFGCDLNWGQTSCPGPLDCNCDKINDCTQCGFSPIVIDVAANGVQLTDAANGVTFDLNGDGAAERLSWTSTNGDDGWLALDRNNNGTIDNGRELFGNFTEQPSSKDRNGFVALAVFDTPAKGGNQDGWIDQRDAVFSQLRVWQDRNHDGLSQAHELLPLVNAGVVGISLDYRQSRRTDRWGNEFRYRAKLAQAGASPRNTWGYDVYLLADGWCRRK